MRLATVPYSTAKNSLKKRFIHLTNFSVNKKNVEYKKNTGGVEIDTTADSQQATEQISSKWSLAQLKDEYRKMGIDHEEIFKNIKQLCIKTLMAVEPQITTAMRATKYRNQCFELYGFDIIVDQKLRPWLLEVNVCPSLSSSSPYDKTVKTMLLCDTLHLVGFKLYDRLKMEEDKRKENKQRLLGFESKNKVNRPDDQFSDTSPLLKQLSESPKKPRKE